MTNDQIGRIQSPQIIRIGGGVADELPQVLAQIGVSYPLIVTDPGLVALGHLDRVTELLDAAGLSYGVFSDVVEDPTDFCVDAGLAAFSNAPYDCIIGFGGGSPMDTAKAISFMSVNAGHVRDYKAPTQIDTCGPPVIAIPTTGGTGSELTRWCVITDTQRVEKYNLSGLACVARVALIDWTFTVTKPLRLTADTAIDSLTHAMEAFVSRKAFAYTDAFAMSAMPLIYNNVRQACAEPHNAEARAGLMLGAAQAGMAFSNASVALVHGMSRPIGAHFHIAHGLSNAMLLPKVTAFSVAARPDKYAQCARIMGIADADTDDQTACATLVAALEDLNKDLKVPTPQSFGIDKQAFHDMIPTMAAQALASGSPQNNPRIPSQDEIEMLYRQIY